MTKDWGGYWTEAKLGILAKYLSAFNVAARSARQTVYLDLFAGKVQNTRPDTGEPYPGSTKCAMETNPPFSRLVFWELEPTASQLRKDLHDSYPQDSRWTVMAGDCNTTLNEGLQTAAALRNAPTFAFIDPKGLEVSWNTLYQLSKWRDGNTKTELWILLPEPALERVLGLTGVRGQGTADQLTRLYGCDDWIAIHQGRRNGQLSADQARAEYVNLLRWRLQNVLGYAITHPLALGNVSDAPIYTMIFATDHPVGGRIMKDIYTHAGVHELPSLRSQALAHRSKRRDEEAGRRTLFDVEPTVEASQYKHEEPWTPPERTSDDLVLGEPLDPAEEE